MLILAQPFTREQEDIEAVRGIVEHGGRVLATGFWGGMILPGSAVAPPKALNFAACKLEPEGLDALAASGEENFTACTIPRATPSSIARLLW